MRYCLFILLCLATITAKAQEQRTVIIPGKGHIDVEQLNKAVDLNQDISQLNITELRILRNSFWAREGYPFRDAFLRGVFQNTTWYDSLMWKRYELTEESTDDYNDNLSYRDNYYRWDGRKPIKISKEEQEFINRLNTREQELRKENFQPSKAGWRVNMDAVLNAMQLEQFDPRLQDKLGRLGFAVVPAQNEQLFHVYEKNDYANFPNFVTTDLYLQLYHLYFDCLLRDVEQQKLSQTVQQLCKRGIALTAKRSTPEQTYLFCFFQVADALAAGGYNPRGTDTPACIMEEYQKATASKDDYSQYLGFTETYFPYSLFRPRGHYTRNETLQRYFRAMMWLQTAPFATDKPEQLKAAVALAELTGSDPQMRKLYQQLTEPMTWLFGAPDNINIIQVYDLMRKTGKTAMQMIKDEKALNQLRQQIEQLAEKQTRIRPKFEYSSRYKINLMPQRYMPDAEVLQEMVDYDNNPTRRALPKGLDIMAAIGVASAERILTDELKEDRQWNGFMPALRRMKQRMDEIDWNQTISTRWINALTTVCDTCKGYPFFMLTQQWQKKELNAALASWAELKHDAILYAKQPFGAECGGGGPPTPVVKGYVEPNVKFWQRAIDLLDATSAILEKYGFMTEKGTQATTRMREEAKFLLEVSKKELTGRKLSEEEYDQLKCIGATFENITLDLISDPDTTLMGWDSVEGTDRKVALIADVYTANANNNPEKCIMYAGVGLADEIYVIVEVEGYLWLMRGSVLSYRELRRPLNIQRLTDEEWQQHLESDPDDGRPEWMNEILVPMKETPKANERYFYSTGC